MKYLLDNFLTPWGYKVSGVVTYQGEDAEDAGEIEVRGNKVYRRAYERSVGVEEAL